MKTKFLITSIISILSLNVFSQSLAIGLKGGATINKISGQSFKDQFTFGYHVGAFATIGIGKKLGIQPEVLLNQINADSSTKFSDIYKFNKLANVQLKYLSIPLLLNYKASRLITLQAGPQFGILLNKNNSLIQNGSTAFKSGDLSMLGGVQIKLSHFRIYGRYAIGLNNINDIDNKDKWTNQGIQLGLGITL